MKPEGCLGPKSTEPDDQDVILVQAVPGHEPSLEHAGSSTLQRSLRARGNVPVPCHYANTGASGLGPEFHGL